ncbi:uncharacterized protein RBU33_019727 [Hipposideros larvatus]
MLRAPGTVQGAEPWASRQSAQAFGPREECGLREGFQLSIAVTAASRTGVTLYLLYKSPQLLSWYQGPLRPASWLLFLGSIWGSDPAAATRSPTFRLLKGVRDTPKNCRTAKERPRETLCADKARAQTRSTDPP